MSQESTSFVTSLIARFFFSPIEWILTPTPPLDIANNSNKKLAYASRTHNNSNNNHHSNFKPTTSCLCPPFLFPLCINIDLFHWGYFFVPFDSTNWSLYIYYIGVSLSSNCLLLKGEVHFLDSFNLSYWLFDSISKSMLMFVMHTRPNPLVLCCLHFTLTFVTPLSLLCHQNMWLDDRNEGSCLEFETIILHFNSNLFFLHNALKDVANQICWVHMWEDN